MTIGDKLVPIDLRNIILEGRFIQLLMLHFPPILAGKRGFYRPSKMRFLRFSLVQRFRFS